MLFFIAVVDIKAGMDEYAYEILKDLKRDGDVTPVLIGRTFEDADVILLLHTDEMEALDDYLIKNVRERVETEELTVEPVYEFTLLATADSMVEFWPRLRNSRALSDKTLSEDDLQLFMTGIDIVPGWDEKVQRAIVTNTSEGQDAIPLMTGHAFHSRDFDSILFYLSRRLSKAWNYSKTIRGIDGVRDTYTSVFSSFDTLVPLDEFRRLASRALKEP